jgi:CheY-like chemotaxis protein
MKILIVEDNPISATVLEHTLDKHGYETLTAHDGEEALAYLESHQRLNSSLRFDDAQYRRHRVGTPDEGA